MRKRLALPPAASHRKTANKTSTATTVMAATTTGLSMGDLVLGVPNLARQTQAFYGSVSPHVLGKVGRLTNFIGRRACRWHGSADHSWELWPLASWPASH